ncbi:hypothetical protein UA08_03125 [Talaromyces atroroseus]|uniref:Uncharacterized protein n=1 Tax=Talaromyces atroroseus TaxID=1441469 RepID=A0A225B478_TALAT|nr:hypothetical protein UA08_03125 [Talaromyces atroroseus]OKL61655.1 hypothetical protein UA08_03125 [Talaromyces atroroseus]
MKTTIVLSALLGLAFALPTPEKMARGEDDTAIGADIVWARSEDDTAIGADIVWARSEDDTTIGADIVWAP